MNLVVDISAWDAIILKTLIETLQFEIIKIGIYVSKVKVFGNVISAPIVLKGNDVCMEEWSSDELFFKKIVNAGDPQNYLPPHIVLTVLESFS